MSARTRLVAEAVVLVGCITLLWILLVPPSAGPDEPAHQVRGAALVRGYLEGTVERPDPSDPKGYELPAWVGWPSPACYRFQQDVPVSCAIVEDRPTGEAVFGTTAAQYQVWGHLLPGVGSFAPAAVASTASRVLDAAVPVLLVGMALAALVRRGWLAAAGGIFAVTPMAWFMFAVVNPSGAVIGGGIALWTGLTVRSEDTDRAEAGRGVAWLTALGWAAMALPRRDGLVWASLGLAFALLITGRGLRAWWRSLGIGPQVTMLATTAATLLWAITSDVTASKALLVAPLAPFLAVGARRIWRDPRLDAPGRRPALAAVGLLAVLFGSLVVMGARRDGFDRAILRRIFDRTGEDFREAVGVLGWLDVEIPTSFLFLWTIGLGLLIAAALVANDRIRLVGATGILATAVLASWTLAMVQNEPTGSYWQGRYYLPLLVGIPIVLGHVRLPRELSARLAKFVVAIALVVLNVALIAAVRRWAVGFSETLLPWQWDTYDTVVPPVFLLGAHVAASIALWAWFRRRSGSDEVLAG